MENTNSNKSHVCVIAAGDIASGKTSLLRCLSGNKVNEVERASHKTCNFGAFETAKRQYTIIDPPSSRKYFDQLYSSACVADIGILVVAAGNDSLNLSFRKTPPSPLGHAALHVGMDHLLTFYTLSTMRLVVAVSKLDFFPEDEQEARFLEIQKHIEKIFLQFGQSAREQSLIFIPISSATGENVHYRSPTMDWWQGNSLNEANAKLARNQKPVSGNVVYTLIDVLDNILLPSSPPCAAGPFSATILQRRRLGKQPGLLLYVRVTCGSVAVGDTITVIDSIRRAKTIGNERNPYKIRGGVLETERARGRKNNAARLEEAFANQYNRDGMACGDAKYVARVLSIRLCDNVCELAAAGNAIFSLRVELVNAMALTSQARYVVYETPRLEPKLEARLFDRGRLLVGLDSPWRPAPRCRFFTAHCVVHYAENAVWITE